MSLAAPRRPPRGRPTLLRKSNIQQALLCDADHRLVRQSANLVQPPLTSGSASSSDTTKPPTNAMRLMRIDAPQSHGTTQKPIVTQAQNYTARDPKTYTETRWEVTPSTQYTDPGGSSHRALNVKHIRDVGNSSKVPASEYSVPTVCFEHVQW